jgi:hypothetical protein
VNAITVFASAVAAALGAGWQAVPSHERAAYVRHRDGRGLFLYAMTQPWSARGRCEVTGEYPPGQAWRRRRVSVTVSMGRDPRAVARDLERRLLPAYGPEFAAALESEAAEAIAAESRESFVAAVLAAVPGSERVTAGVPDHEARLRLRGHGYRHDVRVRTGMDGTVADLDLRGLVAAEALAMLAALGAVAEAPEPAHGVVRELRPVARFAGRLMSWRRSA